MSSPPSPHVQSPRNLPAAMYQAMTDPFGPKPRGPTSGFLHAMPLVFGDACKRLDLYGFSNNEGPEYYNMASPNIMKQHHSAELESWVFHSLVRNHSNELRTCVHRLTSHLFKQTMTSRPQIRLGVFGGGGGKRVINWHGRLHCTFSTRPKSLVEKGESKVKCHGFITCCSHR